MRFLFLIVTIIFIGCNTSSSHQEAAKTGNDTSKIDAYPKEVLEHHMTDLYDAAKWYIYTYNCDQLYKPTRDSSLNIPFSNLELRFLSLAISHDTVRMGFSFMDNGKIILPAMTRDVTQVISGVGFDAVTRKKIFMIGSGYDMKSKGDPRSRYENPLQPEVVEFIKTHKDDLNPWFQDEAKRRKIIE